MKPAIRPQLSGSSSSAASAPAPSADSQEQPVGWVYVMSNECMPGIVKIGYTRRGSEKRAADLTRDLAITAVPGRFNVDLDIPTATPEALENVLHLLLAQKRAERGEFFLCLP
jgi:hypothetical protein